VDDLLSQRKRLSAAHAEFEKTMSRAMVLHRTPAPIAEIRERLEYACDRLNVVTDGIRNRGMSDVRSASQPLRAWSDGSKR
jgi:hypothetical protein